MSNYINNNFHTHPWHQTPSFSSLLLDSISRSVDSHHQHNTSPPHSPIFPNSDHDNHARRIRMRSASASASATDCTFALDGTVDLRLRRAIVVDSWIDSHQPQHHNIRNVRQQSPFLPSDHDRTTTCSFSSKIRTKFAPRAVESCFHFDHAPPSQSKNRVLSPRIFAKTKSRAMELYSDFKKTKSKSSPVSPCKRITAFINTIFRNSGRDPARRSNPPPSDTSTSTCSSASSFSRSCLSKTPSSQGKSSTASTETQRSMMRYHPADVIAGEGCGHKSSLKTKNSGDHHWKSSIMRKNANSNSNEDENSKDRQTKGMRRSEKDQIDEELMMIIKSSDYDDSDQTMKNDDDDGGESCASSDLFELENLTSIGVNRYSEELPLYGTTSLHNL